MLPALQYHYAQLQALAFEEDFDLSQKIDDIDRTYPKYHGMHRAAGEFMAEWNKAIEEDERAVESLKAATKRAPVGYTVGEPLLYSQDEADVDGQIDEEDLADLPGAYREGTLDKVSLSGLRYGGSLMIHRCAAESPGAERLCESQE